MNANNREKKWRDLIENGTLLGPKIISASPIISDTDSVVFAYPKSKEHSIELIKEFKKQGYDWIKIYGLRKDIFLAIAASCNDFGIPFGGHLPYSNQQFIQADVPVSPGNSGGPLLDGKGNIIGISVAKYSGSGAESLGLFIPLQDAFLSLGIVLD